jgi:hypothetical protein
MNRRTRIALFSLLLFITTAEAFAQGVAVYHSPDDSGANVGTVTLPSSGTTTLHLYMDGGSVASGGPDPCCAGLGDEVLGWNFQLGAVGGVSIGPVVPLGDVIVNQTPTLLDMNGGDFHLGELGPTKIADVDVQTSGDGLLSLIFGQVVGPSLDLQDVDPATIIMVPEPSAGSLLVFGAIGLVGLAARRRTRVLRAPTPEFERLAG